jgi:hypothetical protein
MKKVLEVDSAIAGVIHYPDSGVLMDEMLIPAEK